MWTSGLACKSPIEIKSPGSEESWRVEDGLVCCVEVCQERCSPASFCVRPELQTPLSPLHQSYIIVPFHSVQRKSSESQQTPQALGLDGSPDLRSLTGSFLQPESSTQAHRRSPKKQFHSPGPLCRICHEDDQDEAFISPCNCSGSLALVHKSCIEKWLSASNLDVCEICKMRLPIRRETRPLWQWFQMTDSNHGPQGLYTDVTCVLLLTPLCLISVYLCAIGAIDYMKHGVWEGIGLAILSGFLLLTYILWCYVTVRYHLKTVREWRAANQVTYLDSRALRRCKNNLLNTNGSNFGSPLNTLIFNGGNLPQTQTSAYSYGSAQQSSFPLNIERLFARSNILDEHFRSTSGPVSV